eukprot:205918-Chlamydomonas_euryale.AAC.3
MHRRAAAGVGAGAANARRLWPRLLCGEAGRKVRQRLGAGRAGGCGTARAAASGGLWSGRVGVGRVRVWKRGEWLRGAKG